MLNIGQRIPHHTGILVGYSLRIADDEACLLPHDLVAPASTELCHTVAASQEDAREGQNDSGEEEPELARPCKPGGARVELVGVTQAFHEELCCEDAEDQ